MIQANELRVGNLVNFFVGVNESGANYEVCEVYEVGLNSIELSKGNLNVPLDEIDGIPLTSEWFDKFGFTYNDLNGDSGYWQLKYGTRVGLFEILEGEEMFLYDQTELKFVHQLQNLFFALEGAELTIKK